MSEEKKREKSKNKIVPFDFGKDALENQEVDELIIESLKKEADELEERLNSDPALIGVGASDDLFQSIVNKLKEQGIWEEDEKPSEKDSEEEKQSPEGTITGAEAESAKNAESNSQKQNPAEDPENTDTAEVLNGQDADNSEKQQADQPDLERIYEMLPEEDRKAMELGRQVERLNQEKTRKRRRRRKVWKRVSVAAALVAVLGGVSLTSEANRRLVRKAWDAMAANLGFRIPTNYMDEEGSVRSKSKEEIAAMEDISNLLQVSAIDFGDMPKEMTFLNYVCELNSYQATMFYSYKETIVSVKIIKKNEEGSSYYTLDNNPVLVESITNDQDIDIKIWKANMDLSQPIYIAEMEYEDCRYIINGLNSFEELKKIVKSSYFL